MESKIVVAGGEFTVEIPDGYYKVTGGNVEKGDLVCNPRGVFECADAFAGNPVYYFFCIVRVDRNAEPARYVLEYRDYCVAVVNAKDPRYVPDSEISGDEPWIVAVEYVHGYTDVNALKKEQVARMKKLCDILNKN